MEPIGGSFRDGLQLPRTVTPPCSNAMPQSMPPPGYGARPPPRGGSSSSRMVKGRVAPLAVPPLGPRASSGHAWRLWLARHSQGKRPAHWAPGHCLGCSSEPCEPPPKPPILPRSRRFPPAVDQAGSSSSSLEGGLPLPLPRRIGGIGGSAGSGPQCNTPTGPSPLDMALLPSIPPKRLRWLIEPLFQDGVDKGLPKLVRQWACKLE